MVKCKPRIAGTLPGWAKAVLLAPALMLGCGDGGIPASGTLSAGSVRVTETLLGSEFLRDGYTGLLVVVNALSCGLDSHELRSLNNLHAGGIPVTLVLLTPSADELLVKQVADNMDLKMPYHGLVAQGAMSIGEYPTAILVKAGRAMLVQQGGVAHAIAIGQSLM